jgi:hypothetical protein
MNPGLALWLGALVALTLAARPALGAEAGQAIAGEGASPSAPPAPLQPPPPPESARAPAGAAALTPFVASEPFAPRPEASPVAAASQPAPPPPASLAQSRPPGLDLTAAAPVQPGATERRFYQTWWFWTGVGAAVVAGTVLGIVAASGGGQGNTAVTSLGTQAVFQ